MFSLLDADQPIPWPDQPINYTLKWRFWYQEYDPHAHTTVQMSHLGDGTDWSIGSGSMAPGYGAEYDVPKCGEGVAGCALEADGTWVHTITGTFKVKSGRQFDATEGRILPVVAHLHCHAPTCLSMAVHNNETGDLLCLINSVRLFGFVFHLSACWCGCLPRPPGRSVLDATPCACLECSVSHDPVHARRAHLRVRGSAPMDVR